MLWGKSSVAAAAATAAAVVVVVVVVARAGPLGVHVLVVAVLVHNPDSFEPGIRAHLKFGTLFKASNASERFLKAL